MTEDFIQFKKQRELGEIINDTFKFIRETYKSLGKLILKITGPVLILVMIALAYNSYIMGGNLQNTILEIIEELNFELFFLSFFILMALLLLYYTLLYATIFHFIKSYIEHQGNAIEKEVYSGVKKDFGKLLGQMIIIPIILGFCFFLCVIPSIYVWVPLSLAPAMLVFKREGTFNAIGEAFNLIKNNWWMSFLTLVVIYILMYVISFIFKIPAFIYMFVKTMTVAGEKSIADLPSLVDWVYIALNVLASVSQYLLTSIVIIALAFIYYHLNEKKNLTGTYETISNLGSSENN